MGIKDNEDRLKIGKEEGRFWNIFEFIGSSWAGRGPPAKPKVRERFSNPDEI